MKKIIATVILLIFVILSCTNVFAMKTVSVELYSHYGDTSQEYNSLISSDGAEKPEGLSSVIVTEILGEKYVTGKYGSPYFKPIKYNEILEYAFPSEEYVITNDGYYTRNIVNDDSDSRSKRTMFYGVKLYDKEFNLVKEHNFGGYVYEIAYIDGLYYSKYADNQNTNPHTVTQVAVSSDFDEWTETEAEDIPKSNSENIIADNKVKFNGQNDFTEILYEDEPLSQAYYQTMFGDWFVKSTNTIHYQNLYLTKDNIYFIQLKNEDSRMYITFKFVNQNEENFIIRDTNEVMLVPKSELYSAMNELEEAPYVLLNDKILGFSQPPVMESDRILVPMRFLFEQMGATVDWNNDTQSAIATIGEAGQEKKVEFSIDNTTALVNGKPETTDVPARLINDQTFVPLRFLSENLGYNVEWDDDARTAVITTE